VREKSIWKKEPKNCSKNEKKKLTKSNEKSKAKTLFMCNVEQLQHQPVVLAVEAVMPLRLLAKAVFPVTLAPQLLEVGRFQETPAQQ
jgi:hypothetical protein